MAMFMSLFGDVAFWWKADGWAFSGQNEFRYPAWKATLSWVFGEPTEEAG